MQLVCMRPLGSDQQGLGLALRKKFCQSFNFELQAARAREALVLSLGPMALLRARGGVRYLNPKTVRRDAGAGGPDRRFSTRAGAGRRRSRRVPRNRNGASCPLRSSA